MAALQLHRSTTSRWRFILILTASALIFPATWCASTDNISVPPYAAGNKTKDGLGLYYFGREIAHYMTHVGAPWLDRPERDAEERPDLLLAALELQPGDIVADLGCGSGYFSWRFAQAVGPNGLVYGVEIQPEMLVLLKAQMSIRQITNVVGIIGTTENPQLPQSVDLAIMIDVYHECSRPAEYIAAVCRTLKPNGRLVLVEYRAEDPQIPIKIIHKMSEAQIRLEFSIQQLEYVKTVSSLPRQHLIIFKKSSKQ
jgi:SAM-dependent methyltransferase